jgi:hypothetical protein
MSTSRRATLPGADELFRSTSTQPAREVVSPLIDPATATPASVAPIPAPSPAASLLAETALAPAHPNGNPVSSPASAPVAPGVPVAGSRQSTRREPGDRRPTGREKHDKKITVYISPAELVDLERARLNLSSDHGLYIDRGRIVREALAVVLADLEDKGGASILVRRLHSS